MNRCIPCYFNDDGDHPACPSLGCDCPCRGRVPTRAQRLDKLTADDPAGAFAHLLWLHGPAALGIRTFNMRDMEIDPVGRVSFPGFDPPYAVLPQESETW